MYSVPHLYGTCKETRMVEFSEMSQGFLFPPAIFLVVVLCAEI